MSYEAESKELLEKFKQKNKIIMQNAKVKGYDGESTIQMKELHDEFVKSVDELRKKYDLV